MAAFDPRQQRMCVRVVYDGVASAGKTTNLRQLAEIFATQRTCELITPGEVDGRTLYFDWLQIAAGMVRGFPLLCQVISVPGQVVLTPRRRHLLSTADAIVHVCDSDQDALVRTREALALVDEVATERGSRVPLVIQANKQDRAGALGGQALLAALGRGPLPVVEAIASDGIGVIDTFVSAVRGIVRDIQARVEAGDVRISVRPAETSGAVLERLGAEPIDGDAALELLLEEASNALALGGALDAVETVEAEEEAEAPATWRPSRPAHVGPPGLPTEDVPTGFIWPAHTGRAALRSLHADRKDAPHLDLDPLGSVRLALGEFVLSTTRDLHFANAEAARQALVRAARERAQLGPLLAPETVLVAQPSGDDSSWLWTVLPRMPSVAQLVAEKDPVPPRRSLLAAFGAALVDALKVEAQHGVHLDLSPSSFGVRQGVVRYAGAMQSSAEGARDARQALVEALLALADACDDLEPTVASFESALAARLSAEEVAKLARGESWRDVGDLPDGVRAARARILRALEGGPRAA